MAYSRNLAVMDCHEWLSWMTVIDDFPNFTYWLQTDTLSHGHWYLLSRYRNWKCGDWIRVLVWMRFSKLNHFIFGVVVQKIYLHFVTERIGLLWLVNRWIFLHLFTHRTYIYVRCIFALYYVCHLSYWVSQILHIIWTVEYWVWRSCCHPPAIGAGGAACKLTNWA